MNQQPVQLTSEDWKRLRKNLFGQDDGEQEYHIADDLLRAYVERTVSEVDAEDVEAHLFECSQCRRDLERLTEQLAPWRGEVGAEKHLDALMFARLEGVPALTRLLEDRERPAWVREKIIKILADMQESEGFTAIQKVASRDPDSQVRQAAQEALKRLQERNTTMASSVSQSQEKSGDVSLPPVASSPPETRQTPGAEPASRQSIAGGKEPWWRQLFPATLPAFRLAYAAVLVLAIGTTTFSVVRYQQLAGRLGGLPLDADTLAGINRAISSNQLALATDLPAARGGAGDENLFGPLRPSGVYVASTTPLLVWIPEKGAQDYEVTVKDGKGTPVARIAKIAATQWVVVPPLQRGQTYAWQVRYYDSQGKVVPPDRDTSAQFRVMDAATARWIEASLPSQLQLAVLYAQSGLVDEAQQTLQLVAETWPSSPSAQTAQRLLANLKQKR